MTAKTTYQTRNTERKTGNGGVDSAEAPEVLLLDFGGTLDSDGVHWSTIYAGAFDEAGLEVSRQELDRAFLQSERELDELPQIDRLNLHGHVGWQVRRMLQLLNERSVLVVKHWTGGVEHSPPDTAVPTPGEPHSVYDSTLDGATRQVTERVLVPVQAKLEHSRLLLQHHGQSRRLVLVSNFTPNLPIILSDSGLMGLFERVYCSAIIGLRKPDQRIFQLILDDLGLAPARVAMIGDSLTNDIMPAHQAGLQTVWIRGDRVFGEGDPEAADRVVESVQQALELWPPGPPDGDC